MPSSSRYRLSRLTLWLVGPPASGKTEIAAALGPILAARAPTLLVDLSANHGLTARHAPASSPSELERLFGGADAFTHFLTATGAAHHEQREQLDWRFRDALIDCGDNLDLLSLGALRPTLSPGAMRALAYGLPRLLAEYGALVFDGFHPAVAPTVIGSTGQAIEPPAVPLIVMTPDAPPPSLTPYAGLATPAVFLNRESPSTPMNAALALWLESAAAGEEARLAARLPEITDPRARRERLNRTLEEGLLRLGLLSR
ncbi:MAG: hypothetical protein IPK79_04690 [Vampirovibrionales bacterium]|nr:hypothetical protein [Vampirovibrionales bacterium]